MISSHLADATEPKAGMKHAQRWKIKDSLLWYRDNPFIANWDAGRPLTFGAFPAGTVPTMHSENPYIQALYDRYERMREVAKGTKAAWVSSSNSKVLKRVKEEKAEKIDTINTRIGRYETERTENQWHVTT